MMPLSDTTTHIAYSDETHYNVGRYRGIALVSLRASEAERITKRIRELLAESGVKEFKWQKLGSAQSRFAALKMLEHCTRQIVDGKIRVDVLAWDTEDHRHKIVERDDLANLHRMYFHLFKNVLANRWPDGSTWRLYPDENTAIDWSSIAKFLDKVSSQPRMQMELSGSDQFASKLKEEFKIERVLPCCSAGEPLVQLADLLAGLMVFSRGCYDRYRIWKETCAHAKQLSFHSQMIKLSKSDRERCCVLDDFNASCKKQRLGVSLKTNRRLETLNPINRLNFWWYQPQRESDKAPVK